MNRARRRWLLSAAACALRPATVRAGDPFAPPSIAADFDPVSTVWLGAAPGHEALTRGLIEALQGQVRLRCLVPDDEHAAFARTLSPALEVELEHGIGFFLRDHAVLTREADGTTGVVDLRASQYGAAVWCAKRHAAASARTAWRMHRARRRPRTVSTARSHTASARGCTPRRWRSKAAASRSTGAG
jgi:hypothetical protein